MKEFDYSQVKHYKFYGFIKHTLGWLVRCVYRIDFKGEENIPAKGERYIVAINHTCALDPVFIGASKKMPSLHFMAKSELFENSFVAWIITHMYGFPVKRGQGDTTAVEFGEKIINEGHVMAICPEGKRIKDKDGVPQRAKAGVAIIANATGASVLPVAICCDGKIKPFKKVTLSIGKPVTCDEVGLHGQEDYEQIRNAADTVMNNITALWEAERN